MARKKIVEGKQSVIYKADEEKLYLFAVENMTVKEGDSPETAERKQKRRERFDLFQEKHSRNSTIAGIEEKVRRLSYETVPEFIKAAGISYRDLLEVTNGENGERATLSWPTKTEKSMCYLCDSLSPEKRAAVYQMVLEVLPEPLHGILRSDDSTGKRLFGAADARTNAYDEIWSVIKDDDLLKAVYTHLDDNSSSRTMIPYSKYHYLVQSMDVSYHWLLGLDEKTCILAKHGDTEMIMDAYCLLPELWKQRLLAGVKLVVDERKEA